MRPWHLPSSAGTASKLGIRSCSALPPTLRQQHKQVGDTVVEQAHNGRPVKLTIVGTATLPPIGVTGSSHLEMGSGAMLSYQLIPPAARNLFEATPGPNAIPVRMKGGPSEKALRSLQAIGRSVGVAEKTATRCCPSSGRRRS